MHYRRLAAAATVLACLLALASPGTADADASGVIINEFYGRGGSANQPFRHKFIELYNPTDDPINLTGTSLQYRPTNGNGPATATAPLSGTIDARGYFLIRLGSNGTAGQDLGPVDLAANLNPGGINGTIYLAAATSALPPDADAVVDKLGYGTSNSPETSPARYTGSNTTPGSLTRTGFVDTGNNAADFTFAPMPTPQAGAADGEPPRAVSIAEIQGSGDSSPVAGQRVTTRGVITAAYPSGGFDGFYLQSPGTGGQVKNVGDSSDAVFVASPSAAQQASIGGCVAVTGVVNEAHSLTQVGGTVSVETLPAADCAPVTPTPLTDFPASDEQRERYEGMLVQPTGDYVITSNYALNQYGLLGLAVGSKPLRQATDAAPPGPEAEAYEAGNLARAIALDDGSSWNYLSNRTARDTPLPYLSAKTPMRTGTILQFTSPVILDHRVQWSFQPRGQVVGHDGQYVPVASSSDREAAPPAVGGDVRLGAFNVLNYFTDLGMNEPGCRAYTDREGNPVTTRQCEVRGAYSASAFADQRAKIVSAINALDADVVGLSEVENSAGLSYIDHPRDAALADLVDALNAAAGQTRWAWVASPPVTPPSEDVIRTAFIYQVDAVAPVGPSEILMDPAFANARFPLAQRFRATGSELEFVAIVNHFKSKGSGEDDGTGQGLSNPSREAQASALTAWVGTVFPGEAVFLLGDFNAYTRESPLRIISEAGYTNVVKSFEPDSASYQFQGRLGSLDHIFANDAAMELTTGGGVWDINGDESVAFQYSRRRYNIVDFHADDMFASSDHDPLLIGLRARRGDPPTPGTSPSASSPSPPRGPRPGLPLTGG